MATEVSAEFYKHADAQSVRTEHVVKRLIDKIRTSPHYRNHNNAMNDAEFRVVRVGSTMSLRDYAAELVGHSHPGGVALPPTIQVAGKDVMGTELGAGQVALG